MQSPAPQPWHSLAPDAALARLRSAEHGLSAAEAQRRLERFGPNRLPPPAQVSALRRFLRQFHNLLIYMLLAAGAVTALLGHAVDSAVIFGVVLINAVIGHLQEGKAERALHAIRELLSPEASVLREGRRQRLGAEALVPGDVVLLQAGDKVPADLRLLRTRGLAIEEATLTGESVPAEKDEAPSAAEAALGDRHGMAFSGTFVTRGQGSGVVVGTGAQTEIGRISQMLSSVPQLTTPLLQQMAAFGRWLTAAILIAAAATFAFGLLLRGYGAVDMFMAAVALAVAAIPEGLPAIVTITLAIGVQRMARRQAIIRRLPAVETLGALTVICSDKTGTLTRNEMTAQSLVTAAAAYRITGVGYAPHGAFLRGDREVEPGAEAELLELARAGLLCNDAALEQVGEEWRLDGDPTEGALLTLAAKAGLERAAETGARPRSDVIPFESEHRFMASLHHDHAGHGFIYVKGAPERVLRMCSHERHGGEDRPLDPAAWRRHMEALAGAGERVLALAFRPAGPTQRELRFGDVEGGLTLLGLVGLIDPPREEAIAAVARCRAAGIRVKMITGDHALTARAIGAQMGIGDGARALTGAELDGLSEAALIEAARDTDVFARTSPEHKLRLVQALQARGAVVGMTGDGVNDAPALRRADVGVAMGRKGTEVAKEAAEMVLADDNFASIANAVEEGRTVYDNIRKAILFILPTNVGEGGIILAAIALGTLLPITPVQILWVNMITAVTLALALAFEPTEAGIMRRAPRRRSEPLLSGLLLWRVGFVGALLLAGSFGLFLWVHAGGGSIAVARTVAVDALVAFEALYLLNTRRIEDHVFSREGLFGNRYVPLAILAVLGLQLLFTYAPPLQALFGTAALGWDHWLLIGATAVLLFLLVEAEKALLRRRRRARA